MSTPISSTPKTFFRHRAEPEETLRQASVNLPPPPALPVLRPTSTRAPVMSCRERKCATNNVLSFFTRPHALVGDAGSVNTPSATATDTASEDSVAPLEARVYALLVQVHGKAILEQLSCHRKGLVLIAAARLGYVDAVKLLLKTDTDLGVFDSSGENAMMAAASTGQLKVLARLLKAGCSVEYCSPSGHSGDAISYALQHKQEHAAAMMALYHNIRVSQVVAGHPFRHCKGESPITVATDGGE